MDEPTGVVVHYRDGSVIAAEVELDSVDEDGVRHFMTKDTFDAEQVYKITLDTLPAQTSIGVTVR